MAGTVALIAVLAAVGLASAHSGPLIIAAPNVGVAGSQTTVNVYGVSGSIQLRWATAGGELLATGTDSFQAKATIPQAAAPGVYYLQAVVDGEVKASGAFEVTPTPADVAPVVGFGPPQPSAAAPAAPEPAAVSPPGVAGDSGRLQTSGRSDAPRRGGERSAAQQRPVRARGIDRATRLGGREVRGAVREPEVAVTRSGRTVFAGSVATKPRGSGGEPTRPRVTEVARGSSSPRAQAPASLASPAGAALDEGSGSRLGIGIALLALGLVAPLAGFLVADVRRRRARARP